MSQPCSIGVIVPFRDEALVLPRKLDNLARLVWPPGEQRVVFVDDHSLDLGARMVSEFAQTNQPLPFQLELLASAGPPGKPQALRRALAHLGQKVDLIVLTDADVVLEPQALLHLAQALLCESDVAMVCGRQCFVRALPTFSNGLSPVADAASAWDQLTQFLRRLESRFGQLFNVHGQLLAWRASALLEPRAGLAADDQSLVFEVWRRRLGKVRYVRAACFYEEKPASRTAARVQAVRRMRAFLQALRSTPYPGGTALQFLQWQAYRWLPQNLPLLVLFALLATLSWLGHNSLWIWLGGGLGCLSLLACFSPGRAFLEVLLLLHRAQRAERLAPLSDHWARDRS